MHPKLVMGRGIANSKCQERGKGGQRCLISSSRTFGLLPYNHFAQRPRIHWESLKAPGFLRHIENLYKEFLKHQKFWNYIRTSDIHQKSLKLRIFLMYWNFWNVPAFSNYTHNFGCIKNIRKGFRKVSKVSKVHQQYQKCTKKTAKAELFNFHFQLLASESCLASSF